MPKKRKKLSLIEKQVEMKDQIHALKMFFIDVICNQLKIVEKTFFPRR